MHTRARYKQAAEAAARQHSHIAFLRDKLGKRGRPIGSIEAQTEDKENTHHCSTFCSPVSPGAHPVSGTSWVNAHSAARQGQNTLAE